MKDDGERLWHILDSIERIQRYSILGEERFSNDELIQNWMVHHLLIIGEAASKVSPQLRNRYPEVEWKKIIGMRNIMIHE